MKRFTVEQVLARAAQLHIALGVDNDALSIHAPKGAVNEKIRAVLKAYKAELIAYLREQEQVHLSTYDEGPLCARCLDLDRENPVKALPEPDTNGLHYCQQHHRAAHRQRQEEGGHYA